MGFVFWPCLFNTLTTSMGFLALATAAMPVIRDLGVFGAVGMVAAFVVALLLCAALGSVGFFQPIRRDEGLLQRLVDQVADLAVRRSRAVLVGAMFAGLVAALGITRIQVDTYSIDFLRDQHPVRQDSQLIEERFGPYTPLEFTVSAPDVEAPEVLAAIARWQDRIEGQPDVGWTRSAADIVRRLNQILTDGADGELRRARGGGGHRAADVPLHLQPGQRPRRAAVPGGGPGPGHRGHSRWAAPRASRRPSSA